MEPSVLAMPVIPYKQFVPCLSQYCLSECTVRTLSQDRVFAELRFRSHQIYFVADFAQCECHQELSVWQLAQLFDCKSDRFKAALANRLEDRKVRDRHLAFDEISETEILDWILAQIYKCRSTTSANLQHYCEVKCSRSISRGWVNSFILRHQEDLSETKSTLQKDTRLEVPRAFLDKTIRTLREYVQGMNAGLVFNLDEVDMSEWEDRKPKKVIVPKTITEDTVYHRVSRGVKHISIVICITAARESLTPYIVTSQDSEPLRKRLMRQDFRIGIDLVLK
jgi:hypothetical protein